MSDDSSARAQNLHQWGAVTLFHGLPSDRVRAIAQDADGVMWFGTDAGLAKYDGRRTETVSAEGLPRGRVLVLKIDAEGVLWIGTDAGGARLTGGKFIPVEGTEGKSITAIATPSAGRAVLASAGEIFDCQKQPDGSLVSKTIAGHPLLRVERSGRRTLVELTSLAEVDGSVLIGTRGHGLLSLKEDGIERAPGRLSAASVEVLEKDARGHLWLGVQMTSAESSLYEKSDAQRWVRVASITGRMTALRADEGRNLWVGTDGQGAFHYRDARRLEHFTFDGTAGGLRSDHVYTIFVDREDVVWFGTDRGVCRYDPHSPRNETISANRESNFVRTLFQTSKGQLLCGTNRGLWLYDEAKSAWQPVPDFARKTIYAIAEDAAGRLLVGSSSGLYIDVDPLRN